MNTSTAIVVDDDTYSVRILEAALRRWRFNVVSMARPRGLTDLLAACQPSLVLINTGVPDLDASAIVRFIRDDPALKDATVLLHAALDEASLAHEVERCEADGYVLKSRDIGSLERRIGAFLSRN